MQDGTIRKAWETILSAGEPFGIKPCGLGARDTLRTEVCYPLYGHELDENTTPIEAGWDFLSRWTKGISSAAPCLRVKRQTAPGKN